MNWYLILDFDSTIITKESLDLLSEVVLKNERNKDLLLSKIVELTEKGMNGTISFQDSINERLRSIQITKNHIKILNRKLKDYVTPTFKKNIQWLKKYSNRIYIISGGFKEMIIPIADNFNIPHDHIFANDFVFNKDGLVIGLDKSNPLSRSGGKVEKAEELDLDGPIFMLGDGNTDAEMKLLGKNVNFIAFVENVYRKKVVSQADFTARTFRDVINFIQNS